MFDRQAASPSATSALVLLQAAREGINDGHAEIPSGLHRRFLLHLSRAEAVLEKLACDPPTPTTTPEGKS